MSDIICITNRHLCKTDFLTHIDEIAACQPAAIILREKDLSPTEYQQLARPVLDICAAHAVPCVLHSFAEVAIALEASAIHLPLPILRGMTDAQKSAFACIGASCHSMEDAQEAQQLGCSYITAGHIFETDCKKGLAGRGLEFLQKVCQNTAIPVYAIGGIAAENINEVRRAGASGACVMSGAMCCTDSAAYFNRFANKLI